MENDELQKLWKKFDIDPKPVEELNLLLTSKVKTVMNKFLAIRIFSVLVCMGLLIFLSIASFNRLNDIPYLINNLVLASLTLFALVFGLLSLRNLEHYRYDIPLQKWLEIKIKKLTGQLTGKLKWLFVFNILILFILVTLAIHVYYENKSMIEVLENEESITGLIAGTITGLAVAYYSAFRIRRIQAKNLEFLKDLHKRLSAE